MKEPARGEREAAALSLVAQHDQPFTADVDLIGFSNNNRDPRLRTWTLQQPVAEWLRCTLRDPVSAATLDKLRRAIATPEFGVNHLAYWVFRAPAQILAAAADHLAEASLGNRIDIPEMARMAGLCNSLARVLEMP
ncbi:hypothetical protein ACQP2U_42570 (plasmid) [Nocardia sp. CA-084685]|uniref:hypothetical protein n=1 Tax=Nocardia sp. CA-084685 TaxID=3239970 RepID=UPI003D9788CF